MPSVPNEVLRDFLLPLDRWALDRVQFTCRRFLRLITGCMSKVCLRQIDKATFNASRAYYPYERSFFIHIDGRPAQEIRKTRKDITRLFSRFVQTLRSSRVHILRLNGLGFTPELVALVLQAPIVADYLSLSVGSCAKLTPAQFHNVLLHFSPTDLFVGWCTLRACHVTDDLIRALIKNRVSRTSLAGTKPADSSSFCVTDDAVVDFFVQEDAQLDEERGQREELTLHNGSFTKDLFKRLVEANSMSKRMRPLRITVSTLRIKNDDLRDYAQHLSYRSRAQPWELRIYDFRCEQHGAVTSKCLRIVLEGDVLILSRSRHEASDFTSQTNDVIVI